MRYHFLTLLAALILASCHKPGCTDPTAENYNPEATKDDGSCITVCIDYPPFIPSHISTNTTWTANYIYTLPGKIIVDPGVTLTIEPGTIIKGAEGTGTLASALVISKGAKLNACGTVTQPIIFTSVLDNIQPGQLTGTNLTENDRGLWGGLIILGDAPISAGDGDAISQFEGIPADYAYGEFGGNNPNDDSGSLCYVSIRHGGALIGAGNELGALSLGGVGDATLIRNVEVVAGQDDGLDIMGGTVDASNIIAGFMGDDDIDLDMNYDGEITDFLVYQGTDGDEGVETGGPEGTTYTDGSFTLTNGTFIHSGGQSGSHDFADGSQGTINNVDFNGSLWMDLTFTSNCSLGASSVKNILDTPAKLVFNNIDRDNIELRIGNNPNNCSLTPQQEADLDALTAPGNPTGNSNTDIQWTWLHLNGHI